MMIFVILQDKQEVAVGNVMFLLTYTLLPKEDIVHNTNTFSWADRIAPIIVNR